MEVLFTGFEPFRGVPYNPSWDCAQAAAQAAGTVAELVPVTVHDARDLIARCAGRELLLVSFGVAATRTKVCLERFAHNWWKDLDDEMAVRLRPNGPAALECGLPLGEWALEMSDGQLAFAVSHDAGTYVCNALLYEALAELPHAMFVHVPKVEPADAVFIGERVARTVCSWAQTMAG